MAGYIIHLAVGEEYIRQHKNVIKNYNEFINGVIYPDNVTDKSLTHYGPKSSQVHLDKYFEERDIQTDFEKGYFLHLVTDYLFYNKFLEKFSKQILHNDYDLTNKEIESEFKVNIPSCITNRVFYKEGETQILNLEKTIQFIRETSNIKLETIKKAVLNGDKYWLTIKIPKKI